MQHCYKSDVHAHPHAHYMFSSTREPTTRITNKYNTHVGAHSSVSCRPLASSTRTDVYECTDTYMCMWMYMTLIRYRRITSAPIQACYTSGIHFYVFRYDNHVIFFGVPLCFNYSWEGGAISISRIFSRSIIITAWFFTGKLYKSCSIIH